MSNSREFQVNRAYSLLGFLVGMLVGLGMAEALYHAYLGDRMYRHVFPVRNVLLHFIFMLSTGVVGLAFARWRHLGEICKQADECGDGVP